MKIIYGIFRGFPGLGRVSAGIALLKEFQKMGYEVAAISYLQGNEALISQGIPVLFNYIVDKSDITSIGINPITGFATKIIEKILVDRPAALIMDGEPLLQSTICDVYPKECVISLLNPSDLYNESLPKPTICFYHKNYLSCSNAIIHGIGLEDNNYIENGCKIHWIPTIIRQELFSIDKRNNDSKRIIGILGGGSVNSSDKFVLSTVEIGRKIVSIAKGLGDYSFDVYCNDNKIQDEIINHTELPANVNIFSTYTSPKDMYKNARLAIARAGRNVVSELMLLNIPGLLIATNGDYRSKEQEKNIDMIVSIGNSLFDKVNIQERDAVLIERVRRKINREDLIKKFTPGNDHAIQIIKEAMGE